MKNQRRDIFVIECLMVTLLILPVSQAANVALLHDVDDPESDTAMMDRLTNVLGHTVTEFDEGESDPVDLTGQDILIISSTISSGNVAGAYRDVDIPILITEWGVTDEMNISGGGGDQELGIVEAEIVNNTHFITEGLPLDFVEFQVLDAEDQLLRLTASGSGEHAPGLERLAITLENEDWIFLGAIDRGGELNNGLLSVNRRVYYGIPNLGFNFMNDTGWQVFDRSIEWLLQTPTVQFSLERSISPTILLNAQASAEVTLILSVEAGSTVNTTVVEIPPAGWLVSGLSASSGDATQSGGQVKWVLNNTTGNQMLTYQVTPAAGALIGTFSAEGIVTGDTSIRVSSGGINQVFIEENGMVVIEAEHFFTNVADSVDPNYRWVVGSSGEVISEEGIDFGTAGIDYSGDYVHGNILPRSDRGAPNDDNLAELQYKVELTAGGTYYLWVYEFDSAAGSSNTTYTNFDDRSRPDPLRIGSGESFWLWDNGKGDAIVTYDLMPGVHSYFVWLGETGIAIDKFILTTDEAFVPVDLGPPESTTREETPVSEWAIY